jgi:pimeloyl-ACP methyl ester carboxylesterase
MTPADPAAAAPPRILARPGAPAIAYRFVPARRPEAQGPGAVFLGGFASDMTGTKATALAASCRERGQAFLRFDYSGHGESDGAFADGTIGGWTQDALDVLDRLTTGPQILVGSSMGGWIMLLVALRRRERIAGLVGLAAAPDFTEDLMARELSPSQRQALARDGRLELPSAYSDSPYVITRALIEDGRRYLLLRQEIDLRVPVRLLHGMADPDVPFATSLRLAEKLQSTDVVVSLIKDGDHRLSRPQDLQRMSACVAELSTVAATAPAAPGRHA